MNKKLNKMNETKRNEWYENKKIDNVEIVVQPLENSPNFNVRITTFIFSLEFDRIVPDGQLVVFCDETNKENKSYNFGYSIAYFYSSIEEIEIKQKLYNLWEIFLNDLPKIFTYFIQ